jgi:hypothetical protein
MVKSLGHALERTRACARHSSLGSDSHGSARRLVELNRKEKQCSNGEVMQLDCMTSPMDSSATPKQSTGFAGPTLRSVEFSGVSCRFKFLLFGSRSSLPYYCWEVRKSRFG